MGQGLTKAFPRDESGDTDPAGTPLVENGGEVPGKSPVVGQSVLCHQEPCQQGLSSQLRNGQLGYGKGARKKQWVRSKCRSQLCRGEGHADGQASTWTVVSFGKEQAWPCLPKVPAKLLLAAGLRGDPGGMPAWLQPLQLSPVPRLMSCPATPWELQLGDSKGDHRRGDRGSSSSMAALPDPASAPRAFPGSSSSQESRFPEPMAPRGCLGTCAQPPQPTTSNTSPQPPSAVF